MRSATLKDAKKLDGVPSPNTIMNVFAKPGLVRWSDNLLLEAAVQVGDRWDAYKSFSFEEWKADVLAAHKEAKEAAANEGTAIHAAIERALVDKTPITQVENPIIRSALCWLWDSGIEVSGIEQYFVNHDLGLGGMIDVVGAESGRPAIVDWKSTTTEGKSDEYIKRFWKEKAALIAAYAMGNFGTLAVDCWNIYLSRDDPGRIVPHFFDIKQRRIGWKLFKSCYETWVIDKGFDPRQNGRKS
jgi:hypothetical protein